MPSMSYDVVDGLAEENCTNCSIDNGTAVDYPDYDASFDAMFYHYLWTIVAPTIFSIIILAGVTGNTLVLYVILSKPAMRTVTNLLLVNLACADLSFLLIGAPITAYKYVASTWQLGQAICKLFKYFTYVPACVTVYTLVAISVQRYVIIVCSNSQQLLRTRGSVIGLSVVIWIAMLALNSPVLYAHKVKYIGDYAYCGNVSAATVPLIVCFFILAYALPLCMICVLYLLIMCHLREKKRQSSLSQQSGGKDRTMHVARVVTTVVLVFGISWFPLHVQSLAALMTHLPAGAWYELFRILWNCMAYGNSCANPFIYTFVSGEFRKAFRETVCCASTQPRRQLRNEDGDTTELTNMVTPSNGKA